MKAPTAEQLKVARARKKPKPVVTNADFEDHDMVDPCSLINNFH